MAARPKDEQSSADPTTATRPLEGVTLDASGSRVVSATLTQIGPVAAEDWRGTARFRIVRRLGQGGMGVVYEAIDCERHQSVALKTLLHFSPASLYRFKQEFRTLADVQHPNLVRLYELVVTEKDGVFFTMELVAGTDFRAHVQVSRPPGDADALLSRVLSVDATRAAELPRSPNGGTTAVRQPATPAGPSPADLERLRPALRQLAEGVHALHAAGKVHRDIKPSNVLVAGDGRVVILDFGVATELTRIVDKNLSEGDEIVGTVRYMAPEHATADVPSPASDWYSVGVVLYEALVGEPPFVGSAVDVLSMKLQMDPVPAAERVLGVPEDLDALCRALLQREPDKRPTGLEILRRLGGTQSMRPRSSPLPIADPNKPAALIGREAPLRAMRDAFEAVITGRSVTLLVGGASGTGKSAMVQHFLDGLVERGEAVVLRGRAYERESVPYKAVDSVIDALSRYLVHLDDDGELIELPGGIGALARVFPVLRRVPSVGEVAEVEVTDPQLVRRLAFAALRDLLRSLARRRPLVLYIDDVQWGDVDSAALLLELLRAPEAPAVLVVLTYRDNEAAASPFLQQIRERWPADAETSDITLGPLTQEAAYRLALTLLDAPGPLTERTARAVARESRGNPFLVEELVRSNRGTQANLSDATLGVVTLEQMINQRLERLPEDARRLLEIVLVGGRPLPMPVIAAAFGQPDIDEAIGLVRARRFVRVGMRAGQEVVEASHDRFREVIVAQLDAERLREHHGRLADATEASPGGDPEAIAVHLLGAGKKDRAALFVERAAEEAIGKLAFDHAVRLQRTALELVAVPSDARRLQARLGEVLSWAGRGEESARAYLAAADGAPALERTERERAAAEQLLAAGRIDEGASVLHRVLADVGMAAPRSPLGALLLLIFYRLWAAVVGLRFKDRAPADVPPEVRTRIDALFGISLGFAVTDLILSTCMRTRYLIMALREGDRTQVLRAVTLEVSGLAMQGGPIGKRERALSELSHRLAESEDNWEGRDFLHACDGVGLYLRGEWKKAREVLDAAYPRLRNQRAGWQSNANVFGVWTLMYLGELRELTQRRARVLADADARGDLYTSVQLRDGTTTLAWLAADEPEVARRDIRESMARWPSERFLLQQWHVMQGESEIELYLGNCAVAYDRFMRDMPALKKSLLLTCQFVRIMTVFSQGKHAVASAGELPELARRRLREAGGLARRLDGERLLWARVFASILRSGIAIAQGDRPLAIALLRATVELAEAADMMIYAAAARFRLGTLLGGAEGDGLVSQAERKMIDQGVRRPDRMALAYVPGRWPG